MVAFTRSHFGSRIFSLALRCKNAHAHFHIYIYIYVYIYIERERGRERERERDMVPILCSVAEEAGLDPRLAAFAVSAMQNVFFFPHHCTPVLIVCSLAEDVSDSLNALTQTSYSNDTRSYDDK